MRIAFSRSSASDLRGIRRYSERRWGTSRTTRYMEEIDTTVQRVAQAKQRGKRVSGLPDGMQRILTGKHHIYFIAGTDTLFISRVLHGSMNVEEAFFPKPR